MSHSWRSQEQTPTTAPHTAATPPQHPHRRSFLEWAIHGLGGVLAVVIGAPAVAYLLDPRNRAAAASDFKDVTRLSELPVGEPREFVIRETVRDAWALNPDQVVGRVFLIRRDPNGLPKAYTTVCPHLGCAVNYTGTPQGVAFLCPCHGGRFDINGDRINPENNPAPRGMDELAVRRKPGEPDVIQVQFKNFVQNQAKKEEVA